MADRPHRSSGSRAQRAAEAKRQALANEPRLVALGDAVDGRETQDVKPRHSKRSRRARITIIIGVCSFGLLGATLGGGYLYANWRFDQIKKIQVSGEVKPISGQPFNILSIGSDSRAGLTGAVAAQTGASSGAVSGQRSDVVKIIHVDPSKGTLTMLSIPRDTMTTLLANTDTYGKFNRVNVNFGGGPSLLAQTITANFGIPIANTIVVSFGGLINAAQAIGGVFLDFPYPAKDPYSGLNIKHPGCQLVTGFQALAVARSRHYYWYQNGIWNYDGTSDFGRIDRQNAFLRSMLNRAKGLYNPMTINSFLSKIPEGITLDSNFTLNELIGLALRFHGLNAEAIQTYTLPTTPAVAANVGDVLFVNQPLAQEMLVNIFGSQLIAPTNPPPNAALQTPMPPALSTTSHVPSASSAVKPTNPATTTSTLNPSAQVPYFDPVPCTP